MFLLRGKQAVNDVLESLRFGGSLLKPRHLPLTKVNGGLIMPAARCVA
jgi:hypothetical protein